MRTGKSNQGTAHEIDNKGDSVEAKHLKRIVRPEEVNFSCESPARTNLLGSGIEVVFPHSTDPVPEPLQRHRPDAQLATRSRKYLVVSAEDAPLDRRIAEAELLI